MFAAGRMVLRLFVEVHGTLVTVPAPLVMPLRDSDIPMNVPFTFRNKQPFGGKGGKVMRSPCAGANLDPQHMFHYMCKQIRGINTKQSRW